ncbi:STAS domain-containing protein [Pseudonocardia zijingensis]|uniref:STAS domain-containing protein n=1 Tax=Pseudonocardia zijingensis TaxID=153376 RepID=UPI0031CE70EB
MLRQGGGMHADDTRAAFAVEIDLLRPGVPLLQARGRLSPATVDELQAAVERCLDSSPWAVVTDLTGLSELQPDAVATLVALARRAGRADIGLYFVTRGGAVDHALISAPGGDMFDIHDSVASAERALRMDA